MKNLGMNEPEQYMASKGRPRYGTRISTSAHRLHCHVERKTLQRNPRHEARISNISGYCSFCGVKNDLRLESLASRTSSASLQLRFSQNDNVLFTFA
jgi:hypothetical protein